MRRLLLRALVENEAFGRIECSYRSQGAAEDPMRGGGDEQIVSGRKVQLDPLAMPK
jgi:hypothetical protein